MKGFTQEPFRSTSRKESISSKQPLVWFMKPHVFKTCENTLYNKIPYQRNTGGSGWFSESLLSDRESSNGTGSRLPSPRSIYEILFS